MPQTMKKRGRDSVVSGVTLMLFLMISLQPLRAVEEWWTCPHCDCNRRVSVTGDFRHVTGEIAGNNFRISVPGLDPGDYRVMIGMTPIVTRKGDRLVVSCDGKALFRNPDPGRHLLTKIVRIKGKGPMILGFSAGGGEVRLGSLEILNAQGQSLVSMETKDLRRMR